MASAPSTFQPPPPTNNNSKYNMAPPVGEQSPPPEASLGTIYRDYNSYERENSPPVPQNSSGALLGARQIRNPRKPLGVPVALRPTPPRPTDIPGRPRAPDTPPASKDNSWNSNKSNLSASMLLNEGGTVDEDNLDILASSLNNFTAAEVEHPLSEVGEPPATSHWKPDVLAKDCAICKKAFTWYFRRHHCRRCGKVVCWSCNDNTVPLDQNARFHPDGYASKACGPCYATWKVVKKLRHSRANSIAESQSTSEETVVPGVTPGTTGAQSSGVPITRQPRVHFENEDEYGSYDPNDRCGHVVWSHY
ncbi:hypothetical protein LTR37_000522 [Vermiconidia calcicola]|uniref:Uncharacterized protein n=1 Tax=Vermiconidia calcicola TaxID=1690605 RepID=A0ACC3P0G1_9PEZI|nr:hypothetical protein LTR37_000522 [Vermiconidia calcicola]